MKRFSIILAALLGYMVLMTPTAFAASQQSTGTLSGIARGNAFAGYSSAATGPLPGSGSNVVGPLAEADMSCSSKPMTVAQTTSNASLGTLASVGAAQDVVESSRSASSISSLAKSTIKNLNILNGLITAATITAEASSTGTASNATSSSDTTFSALKVAGRNLSATPKPNTAVPLAGLGYVVLNEQVGPSNGPTTTSIGVNAIDVYLSATNLLGQKGSSRVIIGHANSYFQRTAQASQVGASSYSVYSSGTGDSSNISTGTYLPAAIDCDGGNSQVQSTSFSSSTPGNTGAISDSASGQITPKDSQSSAQSNISDLNLLSGLIQGDNITVQAKADWNGQGSGSATITLSNMHINGSAVSKSPSPGTTYSLPGLGTVALNDQSVQITATGVSTEVFGIVITITQTNRFGLPVGGQIIIGHAEASVLV